MGTIPGLSFSLEGGEREREREEEEEKRGRMRRERDKGGEGKRGDERSERYRLNPANLDCVSMPHEVGN